MIRRLYDWVLELANHPHAERYLAVVSFTESSFFPIPPDLMLIPMVIVDRLKAWRYAAICTISSVLGGVAGYAIGLFLFEIVGKPILGFYGYEDAFMEFQELYKEWGVLLVLGAGITPLPYKVFTIASGLAVMNLPVFILASLVARGVRFYLVAALVWRFGWPIKGLIERYFNWAVSLFFLLLVGGFILVKYMV